MTSPVKRAGKGQQGEHPGTGISLVRSPLSEHGELCQDLPGLDCSRKPISLGCMCLKVALGRFAISDKKCTLYHRYHELWLTCQALRRALHQSGCSRETEPRGDISCAGMCVCMHTYTHICIGMCISCLRRARWPHSPGCQMHSSRFQLVTVALPPNQSPLPLLSFLAVWSFVTKSLKYQDSSCTLYSSMGLTIRLKKAFFYWELDFQPTGTRDMGMGCTNLLSHWKWWK